MDKPDIIVSIHLYEEKEGGLKKPLSSVAFGCPFFFENEGFDCRLLLNQVNIPLLPGTTTESIPIKFLFPNYVKPRLKPGDAFKLWAGRFIGEGFVMQIC